MSELDEQRWAVISERGGEASGLGYAEARQLTRRLAGERVSGLCVVTDAAARRLGHAANPPDGSAPAAHGQTEPAVKR